MTIVVDCETGGLDPAQNPLLEIGAVDLETLETFRIGMIPWNDAQTCTKEALEINGIDYTKWVSFKSGNYTPQHAMYEFNHWLEGRELLLAGHNPSFDLKFLNWNFVMADLKNPFGYRTIDLHSVAYAWCESKNISHGKLTSDEIYKLLGIPEEPRPHKALIGAVWEAMAFLKIFRELQ